MKKRDYGFFERVTAEEAEQEMLGDLVLSEFFATEPDGANVAAESGGAPQSDVRENSDGMLRELAGPGPPLTEFEAGPDSDGVLVVQQQ